MHKQAVNNCLCYIQDIVDPFPSLGTRPSKWRRSESDMCVLTQTRNTGKGVNQRAAAAAAAATLR